MANAKFQPRMPRNGPETEESVNARVKLSRPTLTCQPWGRATPAALTKQPLELSAV